MLPAIIRLQVFLHYWSFCCLYFWSNLWPFCIALNFLCPVVPTLLSSPILSATVSTQLWNAGRRVRRESMEWACVLFRIGRIELDRNIPKCRVLSSEMFVRNGGRGGRPQKCLKCQVRRSRSELHCTHLVSCTYFYLTFYCWCFNSSVKNYSSPFFLKERNCWFYLCVSIQCIFWYMIIVNCCN